MRINRQLKRRGLNLLWCLTALLILAGAAQAECPAALDAYLKLEENKADDGFTGYLDEISGGVVTECENGNSVNCPQVTTGGAVIGEGQEFNGTFQSIIIPASGNDPADAFFDWGSNASFTIEVWVKKTAETDTEVFVGRNETDGLPLTLHWWVGVRNNLAGFYLTDKNNDGPRRLNSTTVIADGAWHHVVAVRDGVSGENRLYVDGNLEDSVTHTYTAGFDSQTADLGIGNFDLGTITGTDYFHFDGEMDELAIYQTALSGAVISEHFTGMLDYCEDVAPIINSTPKTVTALGYDYVYEVDAFGNPAPDYFLENAPDRMEIDADGVVSWVPSDQQTGAQSFDVRASNTIDPDDTQTVNLTVQDLCNDDMTSYWRFEEDGASGYANEVAGAVSAACESDNCPDQATDVVSGFALAFNGTNDALAMAASGNDPADAAFDWASGQDFTIEFWMKRGVDPVQTENEVIVGRDDSGGSGLQWWLGLNTSGNAFLWLKDSDGVGPANSSQALSSDDDLRDGAWHHLVVARNNGLGADGTTLLYVDGDLADSSDAFNYTGGFQSATGNLTIGWFNLGSLFYFGGSMDELALYDSALDANIVAQHAASIGNGYCSALPQITSDTPPASAAQNSLYEFNFEASDDEDDELSWYLEDNPAGMSIVAATGELSWTPGSGVTTSGDVTAVVMDERGGTDTLTFTIAVSGPGNSAPEISTTAFTRATIGVEYRYSVAADDADGDTLTWSLSDAPTGMMVDSASGMVTWTPAAGTTTSGAVTLTCDDGNGGTDTETFTVAVSTEPNNAPQITTTATTTATVGSEYSYAAAADDADGDTLTWSLSNAPSGMDLDTASGVLTWTPAEAGDVTITLVVTDEFGDSDEEAITITVTAGGGGGGGGGGGCFIDTTTNQSTGNTMVLLLIAGLGIMGLVKKPA